MSILGPNLDGRNAKDNTQGRHQISKVAFMSLNHKVFTIFFNTYRRHEKLQQLITIDQKNVSEISPQSAIYSHIF